MKSDHGRLGAREVARLLHELGQRTALRGGNPYRARAYTRAAESLLAWPESLDRLVAENRLQDLPGIGTTIAEVIRKLHQEGSHPFLDELRKEVPESVLEMLALPGLRPEKVLKLHKELGVNSLQELERAAKEDRLRAAKGFGPGLQAKILQAIERAGEGPRGMHLHRAAALLGAAEAQLRRSDKSIRRITPAGDFRRGCELVSDLALVAESGMKGQDISIERHARLSVHRTDKRHYGITLLLATGSTEHLDELRRLASERGMLLDRGGLRRGNKIVASVSEESIYEALGLQYVEPELREGRGEVALARRGKLPVLVQDANIRGILHAHTNRSDGAETLEVMAEATRSAGYEYFGVADHSKSAHYAGGLSTDEIAEQHQEIDRLNRAYGRRFRIFKGIESDILADGSLDYPDEILASFDFVVASVHGRFRLAKKEQTERIIRAVENPYTTILGHMTGRQLLRRPGYEVDVELILRACVANNVTVEINANPWRLDLDWRWHQRALELGCMFSINPDAHDTGEIALTHWGVEMARKGGVTKEDVLNCMAQSKIAEWFSKRSTSCG